MIDDKPSITLPQWQEQFCHSLLNELTPALRDTFHTASDTAGEQRFAIYQNNVFFSLTTALGDLYPVVKQLVGDDFFTGTAGVYFRQHPPQQAAMVFLGEDFPQFLNAFEHTANMAYLTDIAHLELARHRAYHAQDANPLAPEYIANISPEELAQSYILLHPSLHCVHSNDPIFSIWQNNQAEQQNLQESITLGEPQYVLVVRPTYSVCMYHVDHSLYCFIKGLHDTLTLAEAIEKTLTLHQDFDAGHAIQFLIQTQLIISITHSNTPKM